MARWFPSAVVISVVAFAFVAPSPADDWPMYRHDAARTACTPQQLPAQLHLQWVRALPRRHSVMGYDRRMEHDNGYQPVVLGKTMFVGTEYNNALLAIDTETGATKWTYYLEGPVRYAPAGWEGKLYVAPDDGRLYCIDTAAGKLLWRYEGAPSPRKVFNHERIASNWSAGSGPSVNYGQVYYGTGIWPIDGTFAHAVNAATGERLWRRGGGVIWGYSCVIRNYAVIPSGKYPNVYDVSNGEPFSGGGLYDVKNLPTAMMAAWNDSHLFNGNKAYALVRGEPTYKTYANAEHQGAIWTPVIDGDRIYGFNDGILKAYRMPSAEERKRMKRPDLIPFGGEWWVNARPDYRWSANVGKEMKLPAGADLPKGWYPNRMEMKAGTTLFAGGDNAWLSIDDFGVEGKTPRVTSVAKVDDRVTAMLAADGKLFVTTEGGAIYCYAAEQAQARTIEQPKIALAATDAATAAAKAVLDATKITEGYCYVWRLTDGRLAEELRRGSSLRVIAIDPDEAKVNALRKKFDAAGILDRNLTLMVGDPQTFELPPYTASVIVSEDLDAAAKAGRAFVEEAYRVTRPYGGTICLTVGDTGHARLDRWVKEAKLPKATVARAGSLTLISRPGALPGADDWVHDRAAPGNTVCSADTAVKPPLGLLWHGGPAAEWRRYVAAGGGSPQVQVQGGRYIIQGLGLLSCVDVYTGRLLWEAPIPSAQLYFSYIEQDLDFKDGRPTYPEAGAASWNKGHSVLVAGDVPAERQSGACFNMTSLPEGVRMAVGEELWTIDIDTGKTAKKQRVPIQNAQAKGPLCWGAVRAVGDVLVATAFDPADMKAAFYPAWHTGSEKNKQRMPMRWLMGMDRKGGQLLWKRRAESGFLNWGVCAGNGRLYVLDLHHPLVMEACGKSNLKISTGTPALAALDIATGRELWRRPLEMLAMELAYSEQRDILVLAQRGRRHWRDGRWQEEKLKGPPQGKQGLSDMWAYQGKDGRPLWHVDDSWYAEPLVLNGDLLITRAGLGFELLTGKPAQRRNPITGQMVPMTVSRGGCNHLIGSTCMTTHRIAYDDVRHGGTVRLRGMRSGCTPSILPANGVMCVLNHTGNYPSDELRSAYVLVHRPQNANAASLGLAPGGVDGLASLSHLTAGQGPVVRLGLNFGAAQDLMGPDGTPWVAAGPAAPARAPKGARTTPAPPALDISGTDAQTFDLHPSEVQAAEDAWAPVAASGWKGATKLAIRLVPEGAKLDKPTRYTIRLHFSEPEAVRPGQRVFAVAVQGRKVADRLDIVKAAGGPRRAIVRQEHGVEVSGLLELELLADKDSLPPVICGVEVALEQPAPAAKD